MSSPAKTAPSAPDSGGKTILPKSSVPDGVQEAEMIDRSFRELAQRLDAHSSVPLYRQISVQIENWIEEGRLLPGDQLASERRLTELLDVSRRTIRAALGDLIERKYVAATHGRGNFVLVPPRLRELRFLALERFSPDHWGKTSYHYDLIHEAESKINAVVHYKYAPTLEKLREILDHPPSGYHGILIIRPSQEWINELLRIQNEISESLSLPLLVVSRNLKGTSLNFVSPDHYGQGYAATRQLLELGYRRIGFISGLLQADYMRLTFEGYLQALTEAGISGLEEDLLLFDTIEAGEVEEGVGPFLAAREFDAVVVAGSAFSIPFEKAVQHAGINIPEQLSVVLISEQHILNQLTMPWTANIYPDQTVMFRSLEVLSELGRGRLQAPVQEFIPPLSQKGASCKAA